MSTHNENLRWRYATKKFDASKKLSDEQLKTLMEATQLSASSFGLQPYRIVMVENPATRAKIREHAWGQAQVTDASHLFVFCPLRSIDEAYVTQYINLIAKTRGIPAENLKGFHDMMMGTVHARNPEQLAAWLKCQAYIAVGFMLSAAAENHIDACPMEGFDPAHVDIDLDLAKDNLTSAVIVAVGFRSHDDESASYKKVRFPAEELFIQK
jgi:nitroreductase